MGWCRLLGLAPDAQGKIFDLYQAILEASISRARKEGKYDEGIVDVKGTAISLAQPPQVQHSHLSCHCSGLSLRPGIVH